MSDTYPTRIAELARELVRIETENPPGNEAPGAEYVHAWFTEHDIDATLITEPSADRPQVGASVGEGSPSVVLNGHLDVVPVGDHADWTHPPYAGVIEDGRLYGRGSVDMKTGVAMAMLAALSFKDRLESGALEGSLVVHAAMGEETGDPGTRCLLDDGFDGDFGVVLEPTECRVATSVKGLAWYDLRWSGEPAHASQPDTGHNPIGDLPEVLDIIADYDTTVRKRTDPLCGQAYATVTQVVVGADTNKAVFADRAHVTLDRRLLPAESVEGIDDEISDVADELEAAIGQEVKWTRSMTYEAAEIPENHPYAVRFRELATEHAGVESVAWGIKASTDARNFVNDHDIPAITWGPGSLSQAHTVDEYIDLEDARTGFDILESVLESVYRNGDRHTPVP